MKFVIILVCLIAVSFGNPFAGNIDLGAVTKQLSGTDTEIMINSVQGLALWFSKDVDKDGYLTHQEIYEILKNYSGDVSTSHLTAALIIRKGDLVKKDGQLDTMELMTAFNWFLTFSNTN